MVSKLFNPAILSGMNAINIFKDLWAHQTEALINAADLRKQGIKKGIALQFTGTGKTTFGVIDALLTTAKVKDRKKQIFVVVPTQEIRSQWIKSFKELSPRIKTFETAMEVYDEKSLREADVIVTHYAYLHRYKSAFKSMDLPVGYVIIDEAHHMFAESYAGVRPESADELQPADLKIFKPHFTLGLTATPIAISGKRAQSIKGEGGQLWIQDLFDNHIIIDKTSEEDLLDFINLGILVPIKQELAELPEFIYADLVKENNVLVGDDFDQGKIFKKINREAFYEFLIDLYQSKVPAQKKDKPTLIVALNIKDADQMALAFRQAGLEAEALHSELPDKQQEILKNRFKKGDLKILIQVTMLAEGYDFPAIETLIMARPIYARHLYLQFLGRGLRAYLGKNDLLLLDVGWNFIRYASQRMDSVFNKERIAESVRKNGAHLPDYIQFDHRHIQMNTHHFFENFILPIQKGELSTTMLSSRLGIAHTTLLKAKDQILELEGVRKIKVKGRETFVVAESLYSRIEEIIFKTLKRKEEIAITEMAELFGVSFPAIVAMENELKKLPSFREISGNSRYRFVIGLEDLEQAEKMIRSAIEPKKEGELYYEEAAELLDLNHLTILHMKEILREHLPHTFRELSRFGKQTFVVHEDDLQTIQALAKNFASESHQWSRKALLDRFGVPNSVWMAIQSEVEKLPTYRKLHLRKGHDYVIEPSDLITLTRIIFEYQKLSGKSRDRIPSVHLAKRLGVTQEELNQHLEAIKQLPTFEWAKASQHIQADQFMIDLIDYENVKDILNR